MKKEKINLILDMLDRVYPRLRLVKDHQFSRNSETKAERDNYFTVRDCDYIRAWLYVDLVKKYKPQLDISQMEKWFTHYVETDFNSYNNALNVIYESVRRCDFMSISISQLKTAVKGECSCSLNTLLGPLRVQVERLYLSSGQAFDQPEMAVDIIRDIVQWTRLTQKPVLDDPSLEKDAYDSFWSTQEFLSSLWSANDPIRQSYLSQLREIIDRYFVSDSEFILSRGKHGSGAVGDPDVHRNVSMKTDQVAYSNPRLNYLAKHNPGVKPTECCISFYTNEYGTYATSDTAASFRTVPKNLKKRRGIALQKASNMWWQQATLDTFYRVSWNKPYVRQHLPIFDRDVNRELARLASVRNNLATLDLSAASDSVSLHLVKAIFGPNVRRALLCARADHFDSDSRKFETYATMGDASTFPVETIVFGACCKLALNLAVEFYKERNSRIPFGYDEFAVFGDDIIISNDRVVLNYLSDILSRLGFIVNKDKSFIYGPYRESCGIEAFLGESIEPFYARLKLKKAERFGSLVGAANECYIRGLKCLRQYILIQLSHICGGYKYIPWTELCEDSSSVFTPFLDLNRLVLRQVEDKSWNGRVFSNNGGPRGSQVWEIVAMRSRSRIPDKDRLPGAEWYGLYTALSTRSEQVSDTPIDYRATTHYISRSGKPVSSALA